ncbi:MAG TPA: acyl-CoA dehydrogenase family protein [Marmoricola sp.]|nr:acyl-CoA dehydrogenase family protein [Marmoricola sp.]
MSSLDAETTEAVRSSLREMFAGDRLDLPASLAALGWDDVVAEDPATATTLLFVEHGRALATSRALNSVICSALALDDAHTILLPGTDGLGSVATGDTTATGLVLGGLGVGGLGVGGLIDGDPAGRITVPVGTGDGVVLVAVDADPQPDAAPGFDPGSSVTRCTVALPASISGPTVSTTAWAASIAAAQRATAAEIVGVCTSALELAVAHTRAREQYGRPIGAFQAVRHRMSECHAAIESAKDTLRAAWVTTEDIGWAATVAKARAGRTQAEVMRHCIQVFGAMGLTEESDLHRYVTRAAALDGLLGGHLDLSVQLGDALLAGEPVHPVARIKETT